MQSLLVLYVNIVENSNITMLAWLDTNSCDLNSLGTTEYLQCKLWLQTSWLVIGQPCYKYGPSHDVIASDARLVKLAKLVPTQPGGPS